jgi:hypothetical protein
MSAENGRTAENLTIPTTAVPKDDLDLIEDPVKIVVTGINKVKTTSTFQAVETL